MRSWLRVRDEVSAVLEGVDPARMDAAVAALADRSRRWFAVGQGRSRLVASMAAMRLMHLGFESHVVGEVTAPSIRTGDGLLVVSASGETPTSLHVARLAAAEGASLLVVTAQPHSSLAAMAHVVLPVPAPGSLQFGGSLFEQTALLVLDAVILDLAADDPQAYDLMRSRHTNLE
jgi:6-phospho-3-hexuloisomerase